MTTRCPSCHTVDSRSRVFCSSCGCRLDETPKSGFLDAVDMLYYASKWVYGLLLAYFVITAIIFSCHTKTQREKDIDSIDCAFSYIVRKDFERAKKQAFKISNEKAREAVLFTISQEKTFDNWKRLGIIQGD